MISPYDSNRNHQNRVHGSQYSFSIASSTVKSFFKYSRSILCISHKNNFLFQQKFFDLFLGRVDEKAAQLHAIANLQNILHKSGGGPAPPANNSGSVPVPEVWHVMFEITASVSKTHLKYRHASAVDIRGKKANTKIIRSAKVSKTNFSIVILT